MSTLCSIWSCIRDNCRHFKGSYFRNTFRGEDNDSCSTNTDNKHEWENQESSLRDWVQSFETSLRITTGFTVLVEVKTNSSKISWSNWILYSCQCTLLCFYTRHPYRHWVCSHRICCLVHDTKDLFERLITLYTANDRRNNLSGDLQVRLVVKIDPILHVYKSLIPRRRTPGDHWSVEDQEHVKLELLAGMRAIVVQSFIWVKVSIEILHLYLNDS